MDVAPFCYNWIGWMGLDIFGWGAKWISGKKLQHIFQNQVFFFWKFIHFGRQSLLNLGDQTPPPLLHDRREHFPPTQSHINCTPTQVASKVWTFSKIWMVFGIFFSERIRIIFGLKNCPNTNTNIIRVEKITRIRIRILFGLKKSPEYEYEYYSVWKYRPNTNTNTSIRSQLFE